MSHQNVGTDVQQICSWLGLAPSSWPPDHYALLGLPACEPDIERIEQQVHERLMRVRSYQLSHPALATEAMTQLAKAFDCLTNPPRKQAYDAAQFPHVPRALPALPSARVPTVMATDTAETTPVSSTPPSSASAPPDAASPQLRPQWQAAVAPPPVRAGAGGLEFLPPPGLPIVAQGAPEPPPVRMLPLANLTLQLPPDGIPVALPAPAAAPTAPVASTETASTPSLYLSSVNLPHLGTRRHLLERLWWLRRFLRAWNRAGKYLSKPKRALTKSAEAAELTRLLFAIDDLLHEVPGLLGKPGQPGYRILALADQEPVAEHFKSLDNDHRKALANDWSAGCLLLEEYRQLLIQQVRGHRRLTRWQRCSRAVDAVLAVYWVWVVVGMILVTGFVLVLTYLW